MCVVVARGCVCVVCGVWLLLGRRERKSKRGSVAACNSELSRLLSFFFNTFARYCKSVIEVFF